MSRSVSVPYNAVAIAYTAPEWDEEWEWEWEWKEYLECFREKATEMYPSLLKIDKWIGREDHALLENAHAIMGVSVYCGLVAFWVVPQEDKWDPQENGLHEHWCYQIAHGFEKTFGDLVRVGAFSNGEVVYRKVDG